MLTGSLCSLYKTYWRTCLYWRKGKSQSHLKLCWLGSFFKSCRLTSQKFQDCEKLKYFNLPSSGSCQQELSMKGLQSCLINILNFVLVSFLFFQGKERFGRLFHTNKCPRKTLCSFLDDTFLFLHILNLFCRLAGKNESIDNLILVNNYTKQSI